MAVVVTLPDDEFANAPPLWLASRSPRRVQILHDAGIPVRVMPSDLDDAQLRRGNVSPEQWVMALAWFKAARVRQTIRNQPDQSSEGIIIAADTLCVVDDTIFGQPRDEAEARHMLRQMSDRTHDVITGVCLLTLPDNGRILFLDRATVSIGRLSDETDESDESIDRYVETGKWQGKAGAYNLAERLDAGWPIEVSGDPATVMGLPILRLRPLLLAASQSRRLS